MRRIVLGLVAGLAACSPAPAPPQGEAERHVRAAERAPAVLAAVAAQEERFAAVAGPVQAPSDTAYGFAFEGLMVERVPMAAFRGEAVLVVNTASRCGFTPQYAGLQAIYEEFGDQGFAIVGVPSNDFGGQEPGEADEIQQFCEQNYGVTFPMAGKTQVIGEGRHPFYAWAEDQLGEAARPGWNFHKLLIGRDGRLIAAFPSRVEPTSPELRAAIAAALAG